MTLEPPPDVLRAMVIAFYGWDERASDIPQWLIDSQFETMRRVWRACAPAALEAAANDIEDNCEGDMLPFEAAKRIRALKP